jgi:hypothetical protein
MGFNRRKMEDQRRDAAEKDAAARRAPASRSKVVWEGAKSGAGCAPCARNPRAVYFSYHITGVSHDVGSSFAMGRVSYFIRHRGARLLHGYGCNGRSQLGKRQRQEVASLALC